MSVNLRDGLTMSVNLRDGLTFSPLFNARLLTGWGGEGDLQLVISTLGYVPLYIVDQFG